MLKKLAVVILILAIMLTSCSCWNLVEVNDTAIVTGLGVDLLENGDLQLLVQFEMGVISGEGEPVQPKNVIITTTGETITQAARNTTRFLPRVPIWSHASSLVIGENIAKNGLNLLVDYLARNRNLRLDSYMFITGNNTSIVNLYQAVNPLTGQSARNLQGHMQIQEFFLGYYVPVSMFEFISKLANPGIEPVLPILTLAQTEKSKSMQLQGMAVFKEGRLAGSLNQIESKGYRWLNPARNMGGLLAINIPKTKDVVNFEVVNFKAKQKPRLQNGQIIMDIEVQADLNFYEQQGTSQLIGIKQKQELESAANQQIKKEIQACIKKSQDINSDVLGWGLSVYRHHPVVWETIQSEWEQIYPQITADIKVKCLVDRTYITTRSFKFK